MIPLTFNELYALLVMSAIGIIFILVGIIPWVMKTQS